MRRRLQKMRQEDGFTIVEILIAGFILVLGSLAVFMTFAASVRNVQRGKDTQVGVSVAQREMEKIRSLPYEKVGMKSTPAFESGTTNPNSRISGTTFNLNRTGTAEYATLVTSATGGGSSGEVEPKSTAFSVGGTTVTVYRYVVWRKDTAYCATSTVYAEEEACKNGRNFKRVIIDVVPNKPGNVVYQRNYYELQSDFVNPAP
jgi:Tfp pilus assembly protein PilV